MNKTFCRSIILHSISNLPYRFAFNDFNNLLFGSWRTNFTRTFTLINLKSITIAMIIIDIMCGNLHSIGMCVYTSNVEYSDNNHIYFFSDSSA